MNIKPYKPRRIEFVRILEIGEWRLKTYMIDYRNTDVAYEKKAESRFDGGMQLALSALPGGVHVDGRPGVGFMVAHHGEGIDYVVMGWWDRQNELPLRIFVREDGGQWRSAEGSESVCVWDLQVIAHERDAYVEHIMRADSDIEGYLADTL